MILLFMIVKINLLYLQSCTNFRMILLKKSILHSVIYIVTLLENVTEELYSCKNKMLKMRNSEKTLM